MTRRAALFALVLAAAAPAAAATYESGRWLADLEEIKTVIAERAPNLDWSIAERGLDLPALAHETAEALREAGSEAIARQVLRDFVGRFGDGHMSLVFPDEVSEETLPWGTASICRGLGYEEETRPAGLPFERIGGWAIETPDSAVFPIHVLDLPAGKLGVLRIPSFYEWGYYQFCPQAVAEVGLPDDGECNEECGAAIGQKAAELLTMAVARQIERLKAEGVAALAVDITQNGGGSLWLDPVARMLTPVKLKAPRLAFTRTEGWRQTFADNLGLIDGDLANPSLSTEDRATLEAARAATQTAMDEAAKGCDRSGLWVGQATHCSLLGPAMFYATGTLDYAPPGAFASLAAAPALFFSALYLYQEGLWQGPLYVLMDEGSASAAEHFASILKDNGAATLIGEPTFGAGCGWMSSGEQTVTLSGTGAELYMPDCVWVRADGENEVAGVEPDILVPWRFYDAPLQKVRRLEGVLKALDFAAPPPGARPAARSGP